MSSSSLYLLILVVICFISLTSAVVPPYKVCSTATAHLKIATVNVNEWPPVSGDTLNVNMTGSVDETVTSGVYDINVKLDDIPIPTISGDISTFKPLPWTKGGISMTFSQAIPAGILPGVTCQLQISAVDQNKEQLFCITMQFTFGSAETITLSSPFQKHFPVVHTPKQEIASEKPSRPLKGIFQTLIKSTVAAEEEATPTQESVPVLKSHRHQQHRQ